MILVAGGTGRLGTRVVQLLHARGLGIRVLTRDPARARHLAEPRVEIVEGDVRDARAVSEAVAGASGVISAIQGFLGPGGVSPASVDRDGNRNLIRAARDAGVEQFVLTSVKDASPDHPMELMRMKHAAEEDLRSSGVAWTIIRPTAFMETWCEVLGRPLLEKGKTMVFGEGRNPINWVSVEDIARLVELATVEPAMRGQAIDFGGPENLTMTEFVEVFREQAGAGGRVTHAQRPVMRLMGAALGPFNPGLARQIRAGVVMDTAPMAFDASPQRRSYPAIPASRLADVVRRNYAAEGRSGRAGATT